MLAVAYAIFRPTLTLLYAPLARISDFSALLVAIATIRRPVRLPEREVLFALIWTANILLALLLMIASTGKVVSKDFNDLFRVVGYLAAYLVARQIPRDQLWKIIIAAGVANVLVSALQPFEWVLGTALYYLYSTPNILGRLSSSGLFYTHTEQALFCLLVALVSDNRYLATRRRRYLFLSLLSSAVAWLSWSKAMIFIVSAYVLVTGLFVRRLRIKLVLLLPIVPLLAWYLANTEYLYATLSSLFLYGVGGNVSYSSRWEDYLQITTLSPLQLIFGRGPLRSFDEAAFEPRDAISLVEVTVANVILRYGFIGLAIYYTPFVRALWHSWKRKDILVAFVIALMMLSDAMATCTDQPKIFFVIYVLLFAWMTSVLPDAELVGKRKLPVGQ